MRRLIAMTEGRPEVVAQSVRLTLVHLAALGAAKADSAEALHAIMPEPMPA